MRGRSFCWDSLSLSFALLRGKDVEVVIKNIERKYFYEQHCKLKRLSLLLGDLWQDVLVTKIVKLLILLTLKSEALTKQIIKTSSRGPRQQALKPIFLSLQSRQSELKVLNTRWCRKHWTSMKNSWWDSSRALVWRKSHYHVRVCKIWIFIILETTSSSSSSLSLCHVHTI